MQWSGFQVITASPTAALTSRAMLAVTTSSIPITINLPTPGSVISGLVYVVKDVTGQANTNNITLQVTGGANINGSATFVISQSYGAVTLFCDTTQWYTF